MNWETKYITHPEYPGWRKRKLVSPDGVMQAMVQTFWERIPGSDPSLPAPPGANRRRINPPWGKWGGRSIPPVEMPNPPWGKIPKTDPGFDLQNWGNAPMPSPMEPSGPRHEYGIRNLFANPSALRSLRERWPSTINPPWANPGRENTPIHPSKRKYYPAEFDPATGQNRVNREEQARIINSSNNMTNVFPDIQTGSRELLSDFMAEGVGHEYTEQEVWDQIEHENKMKEQFHISPNNPEYPQKMHSLQEALFDADWGEVELDWAERLGASWEMVNMVMSTPKEAMVFASENPTDAVLKEFERKYGWPLNVNSPALREYVEALKRRN